MAAGAALAIITINGCQGCGVLVSWLLWLSALADTDLKTLRYGQLVVEAVGKHC